jgi:hypothetical protein
LFARGSMVTSARSFVHEAVRSFRSAPWLTSVVLLSWRDWGGNWGIVYIETQTLADLWVRDSDSESRFFSCLYTNIASETVKWWKRKALRGDSVFLSDAINILRVIICSKYANWFCCSEFAKGYYATSARPQSFHHPYRRSESIQKNRVCTRHKFWSNSKHHICIINVKRRRRVVKPNSILVVSVRSLPSKVFKVWQELAIVGI